MCFHSSFRRSFFCVWNKPESVYEWTATLVFWCKPGFTCLTHTRVQRNAKQSGLPTKIIPGAKQTSQCECTQRQVHAIKLLLSVYCLVTEKIQKKTENILPPTVLGLWYSRISCPDPDPNELHEQWLWRSWARRAIASVRLHSLSPYSFSQGGYKQMFQIVPLAL